MLGSVHPIYAHPTPPPHHQQCANLDREGFSITVYNMNWNQESFYAVDSRCLLLDVGCVEQQIVEIKPPINVQVCISDGKAAPRGAGLVSVLRVVIQESQV